MQPSVIHPVCFSPTRTSLRVARSVARGAAEAYSAGVKPPVEPIDVTRGGAERTLAPDALAVIAVPVYGGHVPPLAFERLKGVRGEGTPAVVIVIYGNRACEHALEELAEWASGAGFRVIGAGTFVGEHSYSTPARPIAAGRPDAGDLLRAEAFGAAVAVKLEADDLRTVDVRRIPRPRQPLLPLLRFVWGVMRLRRGKRPMPRVPAVDAARCNGCGACVAVCPALAISPGDELHTDPSRCVRCCACVKGCPQRARSFDTPFAGLLARNFGERKEPQTLL